MKTRKTDEEHVLAAHIDM